MRRGQRVYLPCENLQIHSKRAKVVSRTDRENRKRGALRGCSSTTNTPSQTTHYRLVAIVVLVLVLRPHSPRVLCKRISPDGGPDNGETTSLRREHINLIGALPYIAEETLNGIGRLNVSVHALGNS